MKRKVSLTILLLLLALPAYAATLQEIPSFDVIQQNEGIFAKIWRCGFDFSCYKEKKLGATLTAITGSTKVSDLDTILSTNFGNINAEILGTLTPARFTATSTSASSTIQWGLEVYSRALAIGTTATTTIQATATSSFNGGISSTGSLDIQSTGATSTFAQGIRLARGCLEFPNGNCALTSGVTTGSVSVDQVAYFSGATEVSGDADFTRTAIGFVATNGTTTNATSTTLFVSGHASTTRLTVGALGVGVSTSTQRNAQIAGDLQVSGVFNLAGDRVGVMKFLATPTSAINTTVLTNGTFTNVDVTSTTTPDVATAVLLNVILDCTHGAAAGSSGCIVRFRQNGSSVTLNLPRVSEVTQVVNVSNRMTGTVIVPVDSSQIFQYDFDDNLTGDTSSAQQLQVSVLGYIR